MNPYGSRGAGYNTGYGSGYGGGNYYPQELGDQNVSPMQVAPAPSAGGAQTSFQSRLRDIVNRAAEFATDSPEPAPEELYTDVLK